MVGNRPHDRARWRLSPIGSVLLVALVVLIVLAIVDPGHGVFAGLILVVALWGVSLTMNLPSGRERGMLERDETPTGIGRTDFGREAADEHERQRRAD